MRGILLLLAYVAKGEVLWGGTGPLISMYVDAKISSVLSSLILQPPGLVLYNRAFSNI